MSRALRFGWVFPVLAAGLLLAAAWQWRNARENPPAAQSPNQNLPATAAPAVGSPGSAGAPAGQADPAGPAVLTPAERGALLDRERANSAAAAPPKTYRGIDGKPKAFRYPDAALVAGEDAARQARREALMRELSADPAAFARRHRLSLKQVQWIVDGDSDFPDAMLEP